MNVTSPRRPDNFHTAKYVVNSSLGYNTHRVHNSIGDLHDEKAKVYITVVFRDRVLVNKVKHTHVLFKYPGHRYLMVILEPERLRVCDVTDYQMFGKYLPNEAFYTVTKSSCCI